MAVDPKLKVDLLRELDISERQLRRRARAMRLNGTMNQDEAIHCIAAEAKLDLSKYLTSDQIAEVRRLRLTLTSTVPRTEKPKTSATGSVTKKEVRVFVAGEDVGTIPALKPSHAREAKVMAEQVYPTIYFFENSVRDLIEHVLSAHFGSEWWSKAVPKTPRENAERHRAEEKNDPWHSPRGRRDIDYVFLNDLWAIIKHQWKYFKDLFPDQPWVQTAITRDMNVSRRVLAHMNPLAKDDIAVIDTTFKKWVRQLRAVEAKLP